MKSVTIGAVLGLAAASHYKYCGKNQVIYKGECRYCVAGKNGVLPHAIHKPPTGPDECRCPASYWYNFDEKECQLKNGVSYKEHDPYKHDPYKEDPYKEDPYKHDPYK